MTTAVLLAVPFVHPALAGAALATGLIPIIVHLISHRRYVHVPWAAMSFLLAANERSIRRIRIERFLLLLTRIVLIVLLGLTVARPYFPASGFLPLHASRVHRVILIDNSMSINARCEPGPTRFDLAKRYAERLLDTFPRTDCVSLVTLAEPAQAVIAQAAYDRRFVRDQLAGISPTQRATDTVGALNTAADILKSSEVAEGNRAVYLITDLPKTTWTGEAATGALPAVGALRRVTALLADPALDFTVACVAPASQRTGTPRHENVGITAIRTESLLNGVNLPLRIMVDVKNFGASTVEKVHVQVRRDGQIIRRAELARLTPGSSATAAITTEFATPGTHLIEARLTPSPSDLLEDDDARLRSIDVRETTPILVVDGHPGLTAMTGQAGFLVTALAPHAQQGGRLGWNPGLSTSGPGATPARPKVISAAELSGEPLEEYDIVALCNVPRLSKETWQRLTTFVHRGGGVFLFLGDQVSVDNYNRHGYADGSGILPGKLGPAPSAAETPVDVGLEIPSPVHPIVAELAGHPESGLFSARVRRYIPLELDLREGEVVLQYSNGHTALATSALSKNRSGGRVLLCTTTANLEWTNLPAKGDFVSLVLNSVAYLSPQHGEHRNIKVGQWIHESLTAAQHALPLRVTVGNGAGTQPSIVPEDDGVAIEYGPIERAEAITVSIGHENRTFVANVDPAESDLTPADWEDFRTATDQELRLTDVASGLLGEGVEMSAHSTELASTTVYLVAALLFTEMWMAMWFGAPRASRGRTESFAP